LTKIGIIVGSTRDARVSSQVAEYILSKANSIGGADFEILDVKEYNLPRFNGMPPLMLNKEYDSEEVKTWSEKIDSLDGFIFVTPEYNKSVTPALKNAIDHLAGEWGNKAAGIVSYGSTLGISASLSLRQILSNVNVATVGPSGAFSLFTDFENMTDFAPSEVHEPTTKSLIETTVAWAEALKSVRN